MSQVVQSPRINTVAPRRAQQAIEPLLTSIVYRSRAIAPLSAYELYAVVQSAQTRNRTESVTGLLIYDNGSFYQWLEGPPASVARIMDLIVADRRHHNIEILSDKPIQARQFSNWTMRLATRGVRSINSRQDVMVPPDETFDALRLNPDHVPAIFATLSPDMAAIGSRQESMQPRPMSSNGPLRGAAGSMLRDVILTTVIPELAARHAASPHRAPWPIDSRVRALAELLIGPDNGAALELIRTLQSHDGSIGRLYKTLLEPAARRLGNLWVDDLCSEFDVTLGLGQLQRAVRTLNEDGGPAITSGVFLPAVLIVPEPGEPHSLTAVLDSDALWQAGWDPRNEYPATDEALQDMVSDSWFDAIDLSLSAAFRREHWLPRVARTITLARHASRNPRVVVVVAGRVFAENVAATAQVGADGTSSTAFDTESAIRGGLKNRK